MNKFRFVCATVITAVSALQLSVSGAETRDRKAVGEPILPETTEFGIALAVAHLARDRYDELLASEGGEQIVLVAALSNVMAGMRIASDVGGLVVEACQTPDWVAESEARLKLLIAEYEYDRAVSHHLKPDARLAQEFTAIRLNRDVVSTGVSLLAEQLRLMTATNIPAECRAEVNAALEALTREKEVFEGDLSSVTGPSILDNVDTLIEQSSALVARTQNEVLSAWDHCGGMKEWDESQQTAFVQTTIAACDEWLQSMDKLNIPVRDAPESQSVRRLLVRKVALLRSEIGEFRDSTSFVTGDAEPLARLSCELLEAELELCESNEQRLSLCMQHVDMLNRLVEYVEKEHRHASLPRYKVTIVKLRMLDGEILLERLRAQGQPRELPAGKAASTHRGESP